MAFMLPGSVAQKDVFFSLVGFSLSIISLPILLFD
jgi:hypothetical protein